MLVLMVSVLMRVLMRMNARFVAMLVPVVGVTTPFVAVLMLMFVFVMAAHQVSPPLCGL
jgi:hypothetical protein